MSYADLVMILMYHPTALLIGRVIFWGLLAFIVLAEILKIIRRRKS